MTTIKPPPAYLYTHGTHPPIHDQIKAIQREAMRHALEEAAKVLHRPAGWLSVQQQAYQAECIEAIRAITIEGEAGREGRG